MTAVGLPRVILPLICGFFIATGVILLVLAHRNASRGMRIAGKIRMKVGIIFLIVGIGLGGLLLLQG